MKRNATAVWNGTGAEGKGTLSAPSTVLNKTPFSFKTRFKNEDGKEGTNPEELIAAAHAGCFTMQLSFMISGAGFTPDELQTVATVEINAVEGGGFAFTGITLDLTGKVSGMGEADFLKLANAAKVSCPVSKALHATPIHLNVSFTA